MKDNLKKAKTLSAANPSEPGPWGFIDLIKPILSKIIVFDAWLSSILLFIIMVTIFFDASGRYFFGIPVPGAHDLTLVFMAAIVFLGIGYAEHEGHHIRADILVMHLPPRLANLLNLFSYICGLAVFLIITIQGVSIMAESILSLEYLPGVVKVPVYPTRVLLVLGSATMCCTLIISIVECLTGRQREIKAKSIE
ncbi:MAG: TRAP transporter small permease [Syntrophales bacterium]